MSIENKLIASKTEFVSYDESFLNLSWEWLNDSEIKQLTLTPDITREGQRKWFAGLNLRDDYHVWGIVYDSLPIGAAGLKRINYASRDGEYFGYIGRKSFWGKGIGSIMINFIRNYALSRGLEVLILHVWPLNLRAVNLYIKNGFEVTEKTNGLWTMRLKIS